VQADKGGLSPPFQGFSAFGGFDLWLFPAKSRPRRYRSPLVASAKLCDKNQL
jgi:hypothetical protein